ncbi:MAG: HU family DNA-binding protein, partial [Mycobacteriaceae bacterium]
MNKSQLIDALAERLNGDKRVAADAVQHLVDIVVRTVEGGDHVTITGFGVFERRSRAARVARNPRTGETVRVAPTSVPAFRPGAQFKAVVAGEQKLTAGAPEVKRAAAGTGPGKKGAKAAKTTSAKKAAAKKSAPKKSAP